MKRVSSLAALLVAPVIGCTPQSPLGVPDGAVGHALETQASVHRYVVLRGAPAVEVMTGGPDDALRTRRQVAALEQQHAEVRPMLTALGATVVGELTRLANAFQVIVPADREAELWRVEGVVLVEPVPTYEPSLRTSVPFVHAPEVWSQLGATGYTGQGIRIGIVDTGIDYYHADLGGSGVKADYEADDKSVVEPGSFPTARVVDGYDFVGDDYNAQNPEKMIPSPDDDPLDCGGHGSHVAGISAGNGVLQDGKPFTGPYNQSLEPGVFRIFPGMAPEATLYAYKVFGCGGATNVVAQALERAVDPDIDGDLSDRLDVVNASLGSSYATHTKTDGQIIANLTAAGSLYVVAAGNDGNTFFIAGSPGSYPHTLCVASSSANPLLAMRIDAPASIAKDVPAAEAYFTKSLSQSGPVTGKLVLTDPPLACDDLENAADIAGNIALVDRGSCPFVDKLGRALAAGALAAVVIDNQEADAPFPMGGGDPGSVALPGIMIRLADGKAIKPLLPQGVTVTLDADLRFTGPGTEAMAGSSSRGPSAVASYLKPEITAIGALVESVAVGSGNGPAYLGGTSMATPQVAGAAALLRQARPDYAPRDIKALLMNTASTVTDGDGDPYPVSRQGSGRIDVLQAASRTVLAMAESDDGRVAIDFGHLVSDVPASVARTLEIDNRGDVAVSYQIGAAEHHPNAGVSIGVAPAELTLAAGQKASVTVTLSLDPAKLGAPPPDSFTPQTAQGFPRHYLVEAAGLVKLTDTAGDQSLRVPFYGVVRAAATRTAGTPLGCGDELSEGGTVTIPVEGDSAHPEPVASVFELGVVDDVNEQSASDPDVAGADIRAVGVASDHATVAPPEDTTLYFAVTVEGEWQTPASGPAMPVALMIDTTGDENADFMLRPEAYTREGPHADVLAATGYNLKDGSGLPTRRLLNIVPRSEHDTQVFHNNVLVLAVFARELGLDEENPKLSYRAIGLAYGQDLPTQSSDWVEYDYTRPKLDAARFAPTPGRPLYAGSEPIRVRIDPEAAAAGELPELLVLHHTNVLGERWQTVTLDTLLTEKLALSHDFPEKVAAGAVVARHVTVTNEGTRPAEAVKLVVRPTGAEPLFAAPGQGSCSLTAEGTIECALGTLAPQASVAVTVQLRAEEDVSLSLEASTSLGCKPVSAAATLSVQKPTAEPPLAASGGCGCHTPGSQRPSWWPLALLALAARRRRRG